MPQPSAGPVEEEREEIVSLSDGKVLADANNYPNCLGARKEETRSSPPQGDQTQGQGEFLGDSVFNQWH